MNTCPECKASFEPKKGQKFCKPRCRKRYNDRIYHHKHKVQARAKRKPVRIDPNSTHPCKRCGGPALYRQVYCNNCKVAQKGTGIKPLTTPRIRNARRREMEAIERVVARSIAEGRQGSGGEQHHYRHNGIHGVKIG